MPFGSGYVGNTVGLDSNSTTVARIRKCRQGQEGGIGEAGFKFETSSASQVPGISRNGSNHVAVKTTP